MRASLNEPVSVVWYFNARTRVHQPYMLSWNGNNYYLGKVDFWHKTWEGKYQIHHFSISDRDSGMYFKLALNADTLNWTLEEYMTAHDANVTYARNY